MKSTHEVALLFDAKAQSWSSKYRDKGPLVHRVTAFSTLLAVRVNPGAPVLDFGGGTGAIANALARQGFQMTVCDLSECMLAAGKQLYSGEAIEWRLLSEDWKRLPFADGAFDAVVASSVFEYLEHVEMVFEEMSRVIRPGGKLIFSVPDLEHLSRQMEKALRPIAVLALRIPLVRALPKIGNYLRYLQVSRARFSAVQWQQVAARAGFHTMEINPGMSSHEAQQGMIYLVFSAG